MLFNDDVGTLLKNEPQNRRILNNEYRNNMNDRKHDLEERLIDFSVLNITFIESLPASKTSAYIAGQLLRSSISPALNYGEAQAAESRNDFIHKMKICLKELRESHNALRILSKAKIYRSEQQIFHLIKECNELIAIFVRSIETAIKRK
jgi:four helix bundle protein